MISRTMARMENIHTAEFESAFGRMQVASSARGLVHVQLPRANGRGFESWLRRFAPGAVVSEARAPNADAIQQIGEFLTGKRERFDLPLDLRATAFQLRAYKALDEIPYGETRTYADQARAIGQPGASRAVGSANGANPLALVIPCHRVVGSGGHLGGYGGGLPMKEKLLALEHRAPKNGELL